jgi:hypothetical protein
MKLLLATGVDILPQTSMLMWEKVSGRCDYAAVVPKYFASKTFVGAFRRHFPLQPHRRHQRINEPVDGHARRRYPEPLLRRDRTRE